MQTTLQRTVTAVLLAAAFAAPAAFAQKRDNVLFDAATAEQPAVIKTLEKLVNIETGTGDAEQAQRVVEAVWQMIRIDVAALEAAAHS